MFLKKSFSEVIIIYLLAVILINSTQRPASYFLLTTEAMVHKKLKKHVQDLTENNLERDTKEISKSQLSKHCEGFREQVEKMGHESDITKNRMSLQNRQKDKMKISQAAKRLTSTLGELQEYLAVTVHSLQVIISHVFLSGPWGRVVRCKSSILPTLTYKHPGAP